MSMVTINGHKSLEIKRKKSMIHHLPLLCRWVWLRSSNVKDHILRISKRKNLSDSWSKSNKFITWWLPMVLIWTMMIKLKKIRNMLENFRKNCDTSLNQDQKIWNSIVKYVTRLSPKKQLFHWQIASTFIIKNAWKILSSQRLKDKNAL